MINKVRSLLLNFFSVWSTYAPLLLVSGMLDELYDLLTAEEQTQLEGTNGFTKAKYITLTAMAAAALVVVAAVLVVAAALVAAGALAVAAAGTLGVHKTC